MRSKPGEGLRCPIRRIATPHPVGYSPALCAGRITKRRARFARPMGDHLLPQGEGWRAYDCVSTPSEAVRETCSRFLTVRRLREKSPESPQPRPGALAEEPCARPSRLTSPCRRPWPPSPSIRRSSVPRKRRSCRRSTGFASGGLRTPHQWRLGHARRCLPGIRQYARAHPRRTGDHVRQSRISRRRSRSTMSSTVRPRWAARARRARRTHSGARGPPPFAIPSGIAGS